MEEKCGFGYLVYDSIIGIHKKGDLCDFFLDRGEKGFNILCGFTDDEQDCGLSRNFIGH